MFWRMAVLSNASPVEAILDKDNFTLEELLDEDDIIQECKALNGRLINFLRERAQVEQLIQYIVVEAPADDEKRRTFKFPFIACEIFTCEVDVILKTLVEDEELMNLLFSFLEPKHLHSSLLAGYFSKVVICLLLQKTVPLMHYIKAHQEIIARLVDLIGITSVMEVLIRLIGADEQMYSNYTESMQWMEDTTVLEMIVDKFSSSDSPEVHANIAETLCAITRSALVGLATKISSPNFIGRLFRHALENSRPKSVLVNSLSIFISLLDPKRQTLGTYYMFNHQLTHGSTVTVNPETVEGMLSSLGDLLKLLDASPEEGVLLTTYGKLQPPLGNHRLKIVEFISVLLTVGSEAAEKDLIQLGTLRRILDLFFEYPYNNFLHHHVENIILLCLESKNVPLIEHLLCECNLIGKILEAEKNFTLAAGSDKPTVPAEGRLPPRIGNIGHLTRISNKLVQLGNNNGEIQAYLQKNSEWNDWQINLLSKRNSLENVYQWACGRPTALHDRGRDSDDDDYQNRDYDVAALANNLSQAFRYGIYSNDDIDETHGSLERDDEDVYFDDESAEVVISSLRLGDDQESGSLFTNSNWFAFEDDRVSNERAAGSFTSHSPNTAVTGITNGGTDDRVMVGEDDDLEDTVTSAAVLDEKLEDTNVGNLPKDSEETGSSATEKPPAWVEWWGSPDSSNPSGAADELVIPNGELQDQGGKADPNATEPEPEPSCSSSDTANANLTTTVEPARSIDEKPSSNPCDSSEAGHENPSPDPTTEVVKTATEREGTSEVTKDDNDVVDDKPSSNPCGSSEAGHDNSSPDPTPTEVVKTATETEGTSEVTNDDKDVVKEEGAPEITKDNKEVVNEAGN